MFAVVFILMFVVCGYLLIYNIFYISVMQDVRQYGLLRTIGTSTRQIKGIVNRQAVWLTLIGLPIGLIAGFFAGWVLLPICLLYTSCRWAYPRCCEDGYYLADSQGCGETGRPSFQKYKKIILS